MPALISLSIPTETPIFVLLQETMQFAKTMETITQIYYQSDCEKHTLSKNLCSTEKRAVVILISLS